MSSQGNTLETADACLLVLDLGDPACLEEVEAMHAVLREQRVTLTDHWEPAGQSAGAIAESDEDPIRCGHTATKTIRRAQKK